MKRCYILSFAVFACGLFLSFTGKNDDVKDEASRIKILTKGRWRLIDNYARYKVKGEIIKHSKWHHLDTCFKDNQMMFGVNNKMYYDQGKLQCNKISRRIDSSFTWRLDNAEDMLWLESAAYTQPLHIEFISDSVLEVNEHHFFGDSAFIKVYKHIVKAAGNP